MQDDSIHVPICWHFIDDEIQDLPSNSTVGPKFSAPVILPVPDRADLVSFEGFPDVLFLVDYRRYEYGRDPSKPLSIHVHLSRLKGNAKTNRPTCEAL